jgi:hypothetical protein
MGMQVTQLGRQVIAVFPAHAREQPAQTWRNKQPVRRRKNELLWYTQSCQLLPTTSKPEANQARRRIPDTREIKLLKVFFAQKPETHKCFLASGHDCPTLFVVIK